MLSLIDWRMAECARLGETFRFNSFADEAVAAAEAPEVVILATGGLPQVPPLDAGTDLAVTAWDILSGDAAAGATSRCRPP